MKIFSFKNKYNIPSVDYGLIWTSLLLLGIGLVMVYSASIDIAASRNAFNYQNYYFLIRQSVYILIGFMFGYITFLIPVYFWQKMAPFLFVLGIILLIVVLAIGVEINKSQRWIPLGVVNFQPSELVKLFTIMYASDYVLRKSKQMRTIVKGFLPMLGVIVLTGILLLKQPDFGALAVITMIAMGILFLGGISYKVITGLVISAPIIIYFLITSSQERTNRITAWVDPWSVPLGEGYQLVNALMAFGRGEFFGVGLGGSVAKMGYLPEAHTDYLLAILGEEFGLFGVTIIIGLFSYLVLKIFGIAKESIQNKKHFSALMAQGIAIWFAVQGLINMGVNLGAVPTKGITLPLMSYGGTGILVNMVALAIILRIDNDNRSNMRGQYYK
ncbi:MAG: putative lipid II flippase FtsW [Methylophilaceae bacterium]|jgi:cell division protein FtsW|nr:putative lipid II flippase FtsW [Methylophilaceae bacterium]